MPTYSKTLDLSDGVAFARALKVSTDLGDKLVAITVDPVGATAVCTFAQGNGKPVPPTGDSLAYDVDNGVEFARALKVHTDIDNELVWIVVHSAAATADCWFV
ncbi:MAG: hypothetical protein ACLQVY_00985 [Limisphaerales bacterium]